MHKHHSRQGEFGNPDLITVARAATILNRSPRTVRRLYDDGKITGQRMGAGQGHLYIFESSVIAYSEAGNRDGIDGDGGDDRDSTTADAGCSRHSKGE